MLSDESANDMYAKTMRKIELGKKTTIAVVEKIMAEIPEDRIVKSKALSFSFNESTQLEVRLGDDVVQTVNKWAINQILEVIHMPKNYYDYLRDTPWGQGLIVKLFNITFQNLGEKHLLRSVKNDLRGVLSTRYRRRHPGELLNTFITACKKHGLLPYEGFAGDTKYFVKAILPKIITPVRNEHIAVGAYIQESAYGNGATEISVFFERMYCDNKAIMTAEMRAVHLGSRLTEDIEWSEETYIKDTQAMCSQILDIMRTQLSDANLEKLSSLIKEANAKQLTPDSFTTWLKKNMSKEQVSGVIEKFNSPDVEMLPPGNTVWRASNAISWFAGEIKDPEEQFEMQKLAGKILNSA